MGFKKKLIIFLLFTFCMSNANSIEPDIFVQSTVNRASQILSSTSAKEEKIEKLQVVAKETVDIKGIGFYTLGAYRKNLNNDQKKKYSVLFEKYFLKSFASRLAEYSNPEIEVNSKEKLSENYTMECGNSIQWERFHTPQV